VPYVPHVHADFCFRRWRIVEGVFAEFHTLATIEGNTSNFSFIMAFTTGQAISFGWRKTKEHFWFFVGIAAIIIGVSGIFSIISQDLQDSGQGALSALVSIISYIIQTIFGIGATAISLKAYAGEPMRFKDLISHTDVFWKYLGSSLLYAIIVAVGFVLLIVPGFIFMIANLFYPYLVYEKKMRPLEALRESRRITKGSRNKLFVFWLATLGINILGALVVGVGLLFTVPLTLLAYAHAYKQLAGEAQESHAADVQQA
jgi:hypothetical protein